MLIRSGQKFMLDGLKIGQTKLTVASGWARTPEYDLDIDFSAFFCSLSSYFHERFCFLQQSYYLRFWRQT